MQFFASCPPGVADLTAAELRDCGATNTREFRLGVQFEGSLETAYRACLWSRTASRVLLPLATFPAATPEELYAGASSIDWSEHLAPAGTMAIEFGGASSGITHTHFGALKTKDAIVDQIRARTGERPSIQLDQPDVRIDVRLDRERATLSLDLSGDSLHRRAYRARGVAAPLKENLAAAVLLRSGWPAIAASGGDFVDPMCGSGTLVLEAALIALDIAPGSMRSYFGFIGWRGHNRELWRALDGRSARTARGAAPARRITLRGYDSDPAAVRAANENVERARLRTHVHIERRELSQLTRVSDATTGLARNESAVRRAHRRPGAVARALSDARRTAAHAVRGMEGRSADRQSAAREGHRRQRTSHAYVVQRTHRVPPVALRGDAGRLSHARAVGAAR